MTKLNVRMSTAPAVMPMMYHRSTPFCVRENVRPKLLGYRNKPRAEAVNHVVLVYSRQPDEGPHN